MTGSVETLVVRSTVRVPLDIEEAFGLFTDSMAEWWPLASHSVHGDHAVGVNMEGRVGGAIVESAADGSTAEWGRVTAWDPPRRAAFTWHPGEDGSVVTHVDVRFLEDPAGGTRLELVHTGWEAKGERAAQLVASYGPGWEYVLGRYRELADRAG